MTLDEKIAINNYIEKSLGHNSHWYNIYVEWFNLNNYDIMDSQLLMTENQDMFIEHWKASNNLK